MKLKFKHQQFQTDAVHAVVDLFKGQPRRQDTFTITNESQLSFDEGLGFCNALTITDERIAANMQEVQRRHSLPVTEGETNHFNVEMETGTGKTYVYTKTIFELNRQYGFTKFIIVVPSVAIREGVYKSFQITAEHFARDYDDIPVRCFVYNSVRLSDIRLFATSGEIGIMIINIDAFKKSENIFNQEHEKLSGAAAIGLIQDTNPIVIIDEPQSVDNTPKAKDAIASLKPLCVLRYSATHREKVNLLYRLTPVDAYQLGLVKQICVSSNELNSDFNRPYIWLVSVSHENGYTAKIEIDRMDKKKKVERKTITIKPGADLFVLSGDRELYKGYRVVGIDCTEGLECIEFEDTTTLALGKSIGNIDETIIKRTQIRRTIECHFEKELRLLDKGIKVLSLFFIDEVGKYRTADGGKGIYADMFEECYTELLALPKFESLRKLGAASRCHDGYFSQDKKGNLKNTRGDTADDYDTYSLIMKDKEQLLSFASPLRFIWSHSALREGWDNPNVFQVCTLIEQKSAFTARQKVGRGLRLCVNQDGERIEDRNINILHVMANESFAEFADTLQREIEQETGVKFGALQIHNKAKEVAVKLKNQVLISPEFLALWDKLKGRTAYRFAIDEDALKARCIAELSRMERITKASVVTRTARMNVEQSGITHTETEVRAADTNEDAHRLPDFLRMVDNECFMPHKTVAEVLFKSGRLADFLNNPQRFVEVFIETIKNVHNSMKIDGIRYMRPEGQEYFMLEIFDSAELIAYLDKNAVEVRRSVYDHIIYDSDTVELPFAKALNDDPNVKMFFKTPSKFKIETPLGTYNPDWAVYMDKDGMEKLYFIIETKRSVPEKHLGRILNL